jgi:hypothetical protein
VQIGAADAASRDAQPDLARSRRAVRKLRHAQGFTRARQHHRAHDRSPIDGNCQDGILPVV